MASVKTTITVTDESQYVDAGQGTVPLFIIATEQDKLQEDGVTVASATTAATAGVLQLVTSQSDSVNKFGVPVFTEENGTIQQGSELNEWGAWALHSYLGVRSRGYALRADIDLAQLQATSVEPTAAPANGTYWFDLSSTEFGVFRANGSATPGLAWDKVTIKIPTASDLDGSDAPLDAYGAEGNVALVKDTTNNYLYEKNAGIWEVVGSTAWQAQFDTVVTGAAVAAPAATGLNGLTLTITGSTGTATTAAMTDDTLAEVEIQIDLITGSTGVAASITGGDTLVLTDTAGGDITLADGTGTWALAGHTVGTTQGVDLFYAKHSSVPAGDAAGSFWIKTTTPNDGADWVVKQYSTDTGQFGTLTNPWYAGAVEAEIGYSTGLSVGDLFVHYDPDSNGDAQQVITRLGSLSAFNVDGTVADPTTIASDSFNFTYNASGTVTTITIVMTGGATSNVVATDINTAFAAAGIETRFEATSVTVGVGTGVRISSLDGEAFRVAENTNTPLADIGISAGEKSNWATLTYQASTVEPSEAPTEGTLWYDDTFVIDMLVSDGTKWLGLVNNNALFDPEGVQVTSSRPTTQASPGGGALVEGDLWLDSADTDNFPALYRYDTSVSDWVAIDKTDQTTPFGIIFSDARSNAGPSYSGSAHTAFSEEAADLTTSDYVDPDAPDPQVYSAGTLLFNTRLSTQNVKEYKPTYFGYTSSADFQLDGTTFTVGQSVEFDNPGEAGNPGVDRWVNASGNQLDGEMYGNYKAQRAVIVQAMAAAVAANEDIRSEFISYNLIAAPGYIELLDEMQTLNIDRKETAFIVSDTPMRLAPNGTDINNWATNANNAASNSEVGRTTRYTYSTMGYPWALGTNLDGSEVMIPPSAVKMRTIAFSDSVSYPWKSAAGTRRGVITNAASVGYLTDESEYQPVLMSEGLRDVIYDNNINPHAFIPGSGLLVWGDKTMHNTASALDRENVARLIVQIRTDLGRLTRPYFFELNNEATRRDFKDAVDRYLSDLVAKEAMYDFVTVCSDQNNSPTRIDRNELWLDCAIEPAKSINFIFIPIRIVNTGTL